MQGDYHRNSERENSRRTHTKSRLIAVNQIGEKNMDYELIFWVVAGIASVIAFAVLYTIAKMDDRNYIGWIERGEW